MLAPNPTDTINQLTAIFNANNSVTVWVHALENAVLPILTPPPDWYQKINAALTTSQEHSLSWLTTTGPQIHSGLSQSFIDYNNLFQVTVPPLKTLVEQLKAQGHPPDAQQQAELVAFVNNLLQQAQAHQQTVLDIQSAMNAYRTQMGSDRDTLTTALAAAINLQEQDGELIQQVQAQVTALMQKLTKDSTQASSSTLNFETANISLVVGLTFGAAVAGGAIPIVGFAVALIGIGVAFTLEMIHSADAEADMKRLTELLGQLAEDKQQLAMVQGVVGNLQSLVANNDQALRTFASFTDAWYLTVYGLGYLLVVLAQPQIDVNKIPDLNNLDAAAAAWQQIADFAQKVQNATLTPQTPINLPPVQTKTPNLRLVK